MRANEKWSGLVSNYSEDGKLAGRAYRIVCGEPASDRAAARLL